MTTLAALLLGVAAARASPILNTRQAAIPALTTTQINAITPYTYYATVAYCTPAQTLAWDCGANCEANPDFEPVAAGGNGDSVQYWYVGYDSSLDTVIVAHQGSKAEEIESLVTDANILQENLNSTLFPGISSDIECHSGFADEQALTATDILAAVEQTMSKYGVTSVTMVGHSLGAAITLLDSIYLSLWLPAGTTFQTYCYGLPRVGNQAFADYVDANLHLIHINNKEDIIPISPGMFLGYVHPAGEVHIEDSEKWAACPDQDNPSTECIVGDVPYIWDGDLGDHHGPYNGIRMSC